MSVQDTHRTGRLDELRRIVPTEQIEAQPHTNEGRGGAWAVEPATVDELVDVVKWANARDAAVYTRHPRSRDAEICKNRSRIYLRARRMKRVRDLDLISGTVTVQSGMTMKELHEILVEHSLTTGFATRPWDHEAVGAVLASALDSHWGPRYGSMEEHVVGLGVILPDGTTTTTRIAPRKAVGPDFNQLFLGSRGRFGIVHEATLKVFPSASRIVLSYGAKNLRVALDALSEAFERGLSPRAMEVLTPAPDRAWGRKKVGLNDDYPVLVLVEPWALDAGRRIGNVDSFFSERLQCLSPPVGWDVHEGLLPQPRAWTAPVVGCRWSRLLSLADDIGDDVPQGLWLVRVSRHGGWLSLADGVHGKRAELVRETVREHLPAGNTPLMSFQDALKKQLDPRGILNPS
jgi:FAD/FMN-containing dehydrogenase